MDLNQIISEYEKILAEAEESLAKAPQGSLRVSSSLGIARYYFKTADTKSGGQYLSTEDEKSLSLIKALAQKEYDNKLIKEITKTLRNLKRTQKFRWQDTPEFVLKTMNPAKQKWIKRYQPTDEEFAEKWKNLAFLRKISPRIEDSLITDTKDRVRSKSEVIISNKLNAMGIPFKYEQKLQLKNGIVLYPDFTVLNKRTRKEFYYEHFGLLDNTEYLNGAVRKIETYAENGFYYGKSLIFTVETSDHPINLQYIENLFREFFL